MRLLYLDKDDRLAFRSRRPNDRYTILSHTWQDAEQEVSFKDISNGDYKSKEGYTKVNFCLTAARRHGYRYVWIDSCCIDQSNQAELSEAINQMWSYYHCAAICYVYLADVAFDQRHAFTKSRWFTRGWTLQELLASQRLMFHANDGTFIGNKDSLALDIVSQVGINLHWPIEEISYIERFKWSFRRETSRPEDKIYSVVGLLDVTLLPTYGEGEVIARDRLIQQVRSEHGRKIADGLLEAWILYRQAPSSQVSAKQDRVSMFLESLKYPGMHSRQLNINEPYSDSFAWVMRHPTYNAWSQMSTDSSQLLIFKAKLGAGKSVLMKYLDLESRRSGVPTCSFYYDAKHRRSAREIYRSLLCQLIEGDEAVRSSLTSKAFVWDNDAWSGSLQSFLADAIDHLQQPTRCFIDAIDECGQGEREEILQLLWTKTYRGKLYVCFSSRQYPPLALPGAIELHFDRQAEHAIAIRTLVDGQLDMASDELRTAILERIVTKANGCFLWVVLILYLLNADIAAGNMYKLQSTLMEIPDDLHQLFKAIVIQDPDQHDRFTLSLQWLLSSIVPLSAAEYYAAMVLSFEAQGITANAPGEVHQYFARSSAIARFVASSSRGLAEVRDNAPMAVVGLIHECVRDYLMSPREGLDLLSELAGRKQTGAHTMMVSSCLRTLKYVLPTPLSQYAVRHTLHHAEEGGHLDANKFLADLDCEDFYRHGTDIDVFSAAPPTALISRWFSDLKTRLQKMHLCMVSRTRRHLLAAIEGLRLEVSWQPPLAERLKVLIRTRIDRRGQYHDPISELFKLIDTPETGSVLFEVHISGPHLQDRLMLPDRYLLYLHHKSEQVLLTIVDEEPFRCRDEDIRLDALERSSVRDRVSRRTYILPDMDEEPSERRLAPGESSTKRDSRSRLRPRSRPRSRSRSPPSRGSSATRGTGRVAAWIESLSPEGSSRKRDTRSTSRSRSPLAAE